MRICNIGLLCARSHPLLPSTSFVSHSAFSAVELILWRYNKDKEQSFQAVRFLFMIQHECYSVRCLICTLFFDTSQICTSAALLSFPPVYKNIDDRCNHPSVTKMKTTLLFLLIVGCIAGRSNILIVNCNPDFFYPYAHSRAPGVFCLV